MFDSRAPLQHQLAHKAAADILLVSQVTGTLSNLSLRGNVGLRAGVGKESSSSQEAEPKALVK